MAVYAQVQIHMTQENATRDKTSEPSSSPHHPSATCHLFVDHIGPGYGLQSHSAPSPGLLPGTQLVLAGPDPNLSMWIDFLALALPCCCKAAFCSGLLAEAGYDLWACPAHLFQTLGDWVLV